MEDSASDKTTSIVVDASGQIAGRLCSYVAKLLLDGNRVHVVNAEKALVSGDRKMVLREWLKRLEISSVVNPKYGPFHPRTPDGILRRMVRGMLPRRKPKAIGALKRLRVYVGFSEEFRGAKPMTFEEAKARRPLPYYVRIEEIASRLGWKGRSS